MKVTNAVTTNDVTESNSATITKANFDQLLLSLFEVTVECWIHQILYVRKVYPGHTFTLYFEEKISSMLCLNGTIYKNQNPQVVSYIRKYLQVVVPSLLADTDAELYCHIIDRGSKNDERIQDNNDHQPFQILESFCFRITSNDGVSYIKRNQQRAELIPIEKFREIEIAMRNLILSIHTTIKYSLPPFSPQSNMQLNLDTLSFHLSMYTTAQKPSTTKETTTNPILCAEGQNALTNVTWHIPNVNLIIRKPTKDQNLTRQTRNTKLIRPIHSYVDDFIGKTIQFSYLSTIIEK